MTNELRNKHMVLESSQFLQMVSDHIPDDSWAQCQTDRQKEIYQKHNSNILTAEAPQILKQYHLILQFLGIILQQICVCSGAA